MKKVIMLLMTVLFSFAFAELINVNPDQDGEKWLAGGFEMPSAEKLAKIKKFPYTFKNSKELPSRVNNSEQPYFRPVFNQVGGSCAQASGVGYTFTYEMNRERDLPSDVTDNQYPTHFTYNFLNAGSGENGSWYGDGWDIIKSGGIPNVTDYGGSYATGGNSRWISGIEEWENGLYNRVEDHFYMDINTEEGLTELKNWFDNHADGSDVGGISVFAAGATGYTMTVLPEGTHEGGKRVITKWGVDVNHAMTYVGYDDSIRFDYNGDGLYTNDVDINRDHRIDMRDWEIGGLIVCNSWGTGWGNGGFAYQMYKVLAEEVADGGVYLGRTNMVNVIHDYLPQYVMKVKIKHDQRNMFKVHAGISQNTSDAQPMVHHEFRMLRYQGGVFYPQGGTTEEDKYLDFTLDVSDLLSNVDTSLPFNYYFAILEEDNADILNGKVISVSVVDKSTGKEFYSNLNNVEMVNDDYTFIPVLIDQNVFKPSNFQALGYNGKVKLTWEGNPSKSTEFSSYKIYRDGETYATDILDTEFVDENVENGTLYTYQIAAVFRGSFTGEITSLELQSMPSEPMQLPYYQDFESGIGSWSIKNDITGWNLTDETFSSEYCDLSGNGTYFIAANSDAAGDGVYVKDYAVSPLLNLSSYSNVQLSFDYILDNDPGYPYYAADIKLCYRTSDETNWIVLSELETSFSWINKTIDIPDEALVSNSTRFGFLFDDRGLWSFGGAFDNIAITGDLTSSAPVIVDHFPTETSLIWDQATPQEFSLAVEDEDTGPSQLEYTWYLNNEIVQNGAKSYSITLYDAGTYEIKGVVSDKFNEDFVVWTVEFTDIEENMPLTTKLYQNYPNPFNPETNISFDVQKNSNVSLKIYDTNGRLVRTLVDSYYKAGRYSVQWNSKDNSNSQLASGVYYYTLETDGYSKTFKALLFK